MPWTIKFIPKVKKELRKLDLKDSGALLDYLENEVQPLEDPREIAIPLKGGLKEYYKFTVGNCRIIADIQDGELVVLVIKIGTRENFYKTVNKPKKDARVIPFKDMKKKF